MRNVLIKSKSKKKRKKYILKDNPFNFFIAKKKYRIRKVTRSVVAQWLVHLPQMLEAPGSAPGSIPGSGDKISVSEHAPLAL